MRKLLTLIVVLAGASAGIAGQPQPAKTVYQLIGEAKARAFTLPTREQLLASQAEVHQWAKHVEQFLGTVRLSETARLREAPDARRFLRIDELKQLTADPALIRTIEELVSPEAGVLDKYINSESLHRKLTEIWDRFHRDEKGLEAAPFTKTRDALRNLIDLLGALEDLRVLTRKTPANPNPKTHQQVFGEALEELEIALQQFEREPTAANAYKVRRPLSWIARQRQAPEVVAAVGTHFNQVNGAGQISAPFMSKAVDQPVHQSAPVHDNILGTSVHGTAVMNGFTAMRPSSHAPNKGQMNINLTGVISTKTTGYNGPVTIYSTGRTSVKAHKALFMTEHGLIALPAHACANTDTNIDCIAARKRIVERIAWRRASASLPEAEAIAARKSEKKVEAGMDERAAEFMRDANKRYQDQMINPLLRAGLYPQLLSFASTPHHMHSYFARAASGQLAGFQLPPSPAAPLGVHHDVRLQFHETLATNMSETRFAGWTLTDTDALRFREMQTLSRENRRLRNDEIEDAINDDKRWAITFSNDMPVRYEFDNNEITIVIRIAYIARGTTPESDPNEAENKNGNAAQTVWPQPMEVVDYLYEPMIIKVRYRIVRDNQQRFVPYLKRIDDADGRGITIEAVKIQSEEPSPPYLKSGQWKSFLRTILNDEQPAKSKESDDPGNEPEEGDAPASDMTGKPSRNPVFDKYIMLIDEQKGTGPAVVKLQGRLEKLGYLVLDDFQTYRGWGFMAWRQTKIAPRAARPKDGPAQNEPPKETLPEAQPAPSAGLSPDARFPIAFAPALSVVRDVLEK